ncbi:universal stress protein [Microbacterium sp. P01]|uniref:universal stress protein n=1 Tax=Microbacterium sp. P01 TaxID=3366261 RepID=UPI0036720C66
MHSIIVGFDGTDASFTAVDWAADRAARRETHVDIAMFAGDTLSDEVRTGASLAAAERRVLDRAPDCEVTTRRLPGYIPAALYAEAWAFDLLVIGSHSGRTLRTALSGWLPLRIAAGSPIPVVVVPDHWVPSCGPIVVGLDEDDSSATAADRAAEEAEAAKVSLRVVHAWQMPDPQIDGAISLLASPARVKAEHARTLRAITHRLSVAHPRLDVTPILAQESAVSALISRAQEATMLVIGTHHWGIIAGGLFGSVAQRVLADARIPVYVVQSQVGREGRPA